MDTRTRILASATRLLPEVGYAAFTMASVREDLGIPSGSLFHAFPTRAALAAAVYVEGMARYQDAATGAILRARGARPALRAWIRTHLGWIEDHPDLARFLFSTLPDEVLDAASGDLDSRNAEFFAALDDLFERAVRGGLMGPLDRPVALAICLGPSHDYGRRWIRGEAGTPPRKISRVLEDATVAALAATVPRDRADRRGKENAP